MAALLEQHVRCKQRCFFRWFADRTCEWLQTRHSRLTPTLWEKLLLVLGRTVLPALPICLHTADGKGEYSSSCSGLLKHMEDGILGVKPNIALISAGPMKALV